MRIKILAFFLIFMAGCTIVEVPAPKQFDCTGTKPVWYCKSRATDKCIRNEYVAVTECTEEGLTDEGSNQGTN